jgi:hypothetical protein
MRKNLSKFLLDQKCLPDSFLVVNVQDWLDFNTKQAKGCSIEVLFRQEELTCFKVNLLDKRKEEFERLIDKNVIFEDLEVVPYTLNGKSFINYSYKAKDVKLVD